MKCIRRILLILTFVAFPFFAMAQSQSLEFLYIAHDGSTPVNALCDRLTQVYEDAVQEESMAVIFYLANADEPRIVKMNLNGDNRTEFEELLGELRYKSAHEIFAEVDQKAIVDIFDQVDFIDESGRPAFITLRSSSVISGIYPL